MTNFLSKPTRRGFIVGGIAAGSVMAAPAILRAQDFYAGKSMEIIIASGPGGFDFVGRLIARHLSKQIPGQPAIVPRNMPGAGGIVAANYVYNKAARDGLVMAQLASTLVTEDLLETQGVEYKATDFNFIGRFARGLNVMLVNASTGVTSLADTREKEITLATTGIGSLVHIFPNVLNGLLGTKMKLISGYTDSASTMLAMEKGEVDGATVSWNSLNTLRADWVDSKDVIKLLQYTPERSAEMPDVECVAEYLETPEQKDIFSLFLTVVELGQQVCFPPEVPAERIEMVRAAYSAMLQDPEFLAEVELAKVAFDPLSGGELQEIVRRAAATDPELIAKAKAMRG
jgi:tripartite-type tricarboxylate transporter receptor subunit TctC